jgi:hypothetical protein
MIRMLHARVRNLFSLLRQHAQSCLVMADKRRPFSPVLIREEIRSLADVIEGAERELLDAIDTCTMPDATDWQEDDQVVIIAPWPEGGGL